MSTFHSERLGADLHLGKLPATSPRSSVRYADLRPALVKASLLPPLPLLWGHGHDWPQGKWLMLGNGPVGPGEGTLPAGWTAAEQGCGDCTVAGAAHEVMEAARNAGRPVPGFSAATVVEQYMTIGALGGAAYNPATGEGDNGLDIQTVNEYRRNHGLKDDLGTPHLILDPVVLRPGNVQELWEASWLFEKVGLGLVLTEAQIGQFDERAQPTWDWVPSSPEIGGHYVPMMGKLGAISWAEDVYMTPKFLEEQNDEAWAVIQPEEFRAVTGLTLEHWSEADLERFVVELAQQKLNPVPTGFAEIKPL